MPAWLSKLLVWAAPYIAGYLERSAARLLKRPAPTTPATISTSITLQPSGVSMTIKDTIQAKIVALQAKDVADTQAEQAAAVEAVQASTMRQQQAAKDIHELQSILDTAGPLIEMEGPEAHAFLDSLISKATAAA